MFRLIKKIFIGLLTGLVNGPTHTKCVSLNNQKFKLLLLIYTLMNIVNSLPSICG